MSEAQLCAEQDMWRQEMATKAAYAYRQGGASSISGAHAECDRLSEMNARLRQHLESFAGVIGTIESFNNRLLGAQPEDPSRPGVPTCAPDGKLDELAEAIGGVGYQINQLALQVKRLEKIG